MRSRTSASGREAKMSRRPASPSDAVLTPFLAVAGLFLHGPEPALSLARGVVRAEPSFRELPAAAGWSLLRMTASYVLSLAVAWAAGYWAAVNPRAARVILPLLDVGQSVPVPGVLPAASSALV